MPRVQRVSDVIELISERAFYYGIGSIAVLAFSTLLLVYHGQSDMFTPLGRILLIIALGGMGYATYVGLQTRKVTREAVHCPFCQTVNELVGSPNDDFPCVNCNRMVPIIGGKVLDVSQVRCGYCNTLNYFSDKTEVLLCEECNHEIPLAREDGGTKKSLPLGFAVIEDEAMYELVLTGAGAKEEELIQTLQQMLALNRNQVKQMLAELPVTLLTGINRRKAEMLKAQISLHYGEVEFRQMEEGRF